MLDKDFLPQLAYNTNTTRLKLHVLHWLPKHGRHFCPFGVVCVVGNGILERNFELVHPSYTGHVPNFISRAIYSCSVGLVKFRSSACRAVQQDFAASQALTSPLIWVKTFTFWISLWGWEVKLKTIPRQSPHPQQWAIERSHTSSGRNANGCKVFPV